MKQKSKLRLSLETSFMFSAYKLAAALLLFGAALKAAAVPSLRVCSDPNNMPYSNRRGHGFENKIARAYCKGSVEIGFILLYSTTRELLSANPDSRRLRCSYGGHCRL